MKKCGFSTENKQLFLAEIFGKHDKDLWIYRLFFGW